MKNLLSVISVSFKRQVLYKSKCAKWKTYFNFVLPKKVVQELLIFIQTIISSLWGLTVDSKDDANVMMTIVILWRLVSLTQDVTKDLVVMVSFSSESSFVICFNFSSFLLCLFYYTYSFCVWMLGLWNWPNTLQTGFLHFYSLW